MAPTQRKIRNQSKKFGRLKTDISSNNNSSPTVLPLTRQSEQQKRLTYLHASVAIDTICCPGSQQRMPIDQCDRNRETVWCNNIVTGSSRMNLASLTLRASSVNFLSFVLSQQQHCCHGDLHSMLLLLAICILKSSAFIIIIIISSGHLYIGIIINTVAVCRCM